MSTPFVRFPGVAGNYVPTLNSTNILDADTAHIVQSAGLWTAGAVSTAQALFGPSSLLVTGGVLTAVTPVTDAASFSVWVWSAAGDTFDINGGTPVVVPADKWTQLTAAGPAGTYTVNAVGAADYYLDAACLQASGVEFLPSLNIVGDIDLRADAAIDNTVFNELLSKASASVSTYRMAPWVADMNAFFRVSAATVAVAWNGTLTTTARQLWRVTRDASTGTCEFFLDGVSQGTRAGAVGALDVSTFDVAVGDLAASAGARLLEADVRTAEIKDGIDGPSVATFDAADAARAIAL